MQWKEESQGGDRGTKSDVLSFLCRSQLLSPKNLPGSQVSSSS